MKPEEELKRLGKSILEKLEEKKNPWIDIPIRSLSNVRFDEERGLLVLGDRKLKRYFLHAAHARKFMQTVLIAAFAKELIEGGITTSLRDLFYTLNRTLPEIKEDLFEEQHESDPIIEDLEVALDLLREQMNIIASKRGAMVGNITIIDAGDRIDCRHVGSGGWAIPSKVEPDVVKFEEVEADFVLFVEKDAIWNRLNEDKFWREHNCILMTSMGQASRGCRRLMHRFSQELKLPIYALCIDGDESVIIREKGLIKSVKIRELAKEVLPIAYPNGAGVSYVEKSEVLCYQKGMKFFPILSVVELPAPSTIEIRLANGFSLAATPDHRIMKLGEGELIYAPVSQLKEGDLVAVPLNIPNNESLEEINLLEWIKESELAEKAWVVSSSARWKRSYGWLNAKPLKELFEASEIPGDLYLRWGKSELKIPHKLKVSREFCRLLGYFASEGCIRSGGGIQLSFGPKEEKYVKDAARCVKKCFGFDAHVYEGEHEIVVSFGGNLLGHLFAKIFKTGRTALDKEVPFVIFNVPKRMKIEFLKGYFRGDGRVDWGEERSSIRLWAKTVSRKLATDLVYLLLQLGIYPTVQFPKFEKSRAYLISINNRRDLRKLKEIVLDLKPEISPYLRGKMRKTPHYYSLPKELTKKVVPLLKHLYRGEIEHKFSPIFYTKRTSYEKFRSMKRSSSKMARILHIIGEGFLDKEFLARDIVCVYRRRYRRPIHVSEVSRRLSLLAKEGLIDRRKIKGMRFVYASTQYLRSMFKIYNLISELMENELILIPVTKIIEDNKERKVYSIQSIGPSNFVGGLGTINNHNCDCDPWGFYIYSVIKQGSINLAYLSRDLAVPHARYIGMLMSDVEKFGLEEERLRKLSKLKLKSLDIKRAKELLKYPWFKSKRWQEEINLMLKKGFKLEIEALSSRGIKFISEVYLPTKLEQKDFLS